MRHSIRLICFDLDNTFWPIEPVIVAADQAVQDWLREQHPALEAELSPALLREERMRLAAATPERAHDLTWLRIEALARAAMARGHPETIGAAGFEVFIEARHRVEFYPDVLPALDLLAREFRLATLSNGNADLARIGCAQRFEFTLNAGHIGAAKPDPRAFLEVLRRSACAADEVLYVGDDPHHDVAGARGAGLRAAWMRRDPAQAWPAGSAAPDLVLGSLVDLVSALRAAR